MGEEVEAGEVEEGEAKGGGQEEEEGRDGRRQAGSRPVLSKTTMTDFLDENRSSKERGAFNLGLGLREWFS